MHLPSSFSFRKFLKNEILSRAECTDSRRSHNYELMPFRIGKNCRADRSSCTFLAGNSQACSLTRCGKANHDPSSRVEHGKVKGLSSCLHSLQLFLVVPCQAALQWFCHYQTPIANSRRISFLLCPHVSNLLFRINLPPYHDHRRCNPFPLSPRLLARTKLFQFTRFILEAYHIESKICLQKELAHFPPIGARCLVGTCHRSVKCPFPLLP